ncbi:hypothetical protein PIB30_092693, partial [Stylosanthes scabra]|nr:hypothetical protein [Stylosanthes scabra]
LLLDPLILVGSILHLIVVYYLIRFGILAEIVGLQKIRIMDFHAYLGLWNACELLELLLRISLVFYAYAWTLNLVGKVKAMLRLPGARLGVDFACC